MILEAVQVAHAILDELGPHELAARVPQLAVGGKDAVAQKVAEVGVEVGTLAVVGELGGQQGLDVVRLGREDDGVASHVGLAGVAANLGELVEPILHVLVAPVVADASVDEVDAFFF